MRVCSGLGLAWIQLLCQVDRDPSDFLLPDPYPEEIAESGEIHEEGDAAAFYLQLLPAPQTAAFQLLLFHGTSLTLVASSHHKPARPSGLSSTVPYTHLTGLSFFNPDRAARQLHAPLCKGCVQWKVSC
jgi:hypothetical protein